MVQPVFCIVDTVSCQIDCHTQGPGVFKKQTINFPDDLKFTLGDYFLIHNDVDSTPTFPTTRTRTEGPEPGTSSEPGTSQEGTAETGNGQETTVGPKIGTSKETTTEEPKVQGALVLSAVFLLMSFLSDPDPIIVFPCQ